MINEIEKLIDNVYLIPYDRDAIDSIDKALTTLKKFVESNHFLRSKFYNEKIAEIWDQTEELSSIKSDEDRLLQKRIQKQIANLARLILEEKKKYLLFMDGI